MNPAFDPAPGCGRLSAVHEARLVFLDNVYAYGLVTA